MPHARAHHVRVQLQMRLCQVYRPSKCLSLPLAQRTSLKESQERLSLQFSSNLYYSFYYPLFYLIFFTKLLPHAFSLYLPSESIGFVVPTDSWLLFLEFFHPRMLVLDGLIALWSFRIISDFEDHQISNYDYGNGLHMLL